MKAWILCYVGFVLVSFVAELLLEHTRFANIASKAISIVVFVALSVPVIVSLTNFDFTKISGSSLFETDGSYIESANSYKINCIKKDIIEELESNGIIGAEVYFSTSDNNEEMVIEKIYVDVSLAEYNKIEMNIDKIKILVTNAYSFDAEYVEVYE